MVTRDRPGVLCPRLLGRQGRWRGSRPVLVLNMVMKGYTVFAIYEHDCDQRYTTYVDAATPEDAERKAISEAEATIIVAGVVEGRIKVVDRVSDLAVTPLRGRGYETSVACVNVAYRRVRLPFHCPKCKADLRKADALYQWDWWSHVWHGRLPRREFKAAHGHVGATLNQDIGARQPTDTSGTVVGVIVQCSKCKHEMWNGYDEVAA